MKENRKTGMNSGFAGVFCNLLLFQKWIIMFKMNINLEMYILNMEYSYIKIGK